MAFSLADMLKEVSNPDTGREQIEYIRLDLIDSDANNFYQLSDIDGLADNIAFAGLQQPIRVRKNPGNNRYTIISGHRRRAAIELLAKEEPEKWQEVSCIVQQDAGSPALQQLQLIFANSSTRKLTSAEISEQAVQVEKLLYQLKEEEGYEFPGRMRDHVSEVVGVSKTKIARLKVIRENLSPSWFQRFQNNELKESTAYALAQVKPEYQVVMFNALEESGRLACLFESDIPKYVQRLEKIEALTCKKTEEHCEHAAQKMNKAVQLCTYQTCHCNKCCSKCPDLISCKNACPKLADKIKKLKEKAKYAKRQEKAAKAEEERPQIEQIQNLWLRFGYLRDRAGKTVKEVLDAVDIYYHKDDDKKYAALEDGTAKITTTTKLPYNYSCYLSDVNRFIAMADLFDCSLDYLLCRTDDPDPKPAENVSKPDTEEKEPGFIPGAWYAASVEPPVGEKLILMDSGGYVDTGKYKGCGEYDMDYGDPVVLWTPMPEEKDVVTSLPVSYGWNTGHPEAYGTYVAYMLVDGAAKPIIRELLWDGECWYLHGDQIHDDVTVQCWAERPEL